MYLFALVGFVVLGVHALEEMQCSKYHFEEKVLEKMIRMELQMEKMKTEYAESVARIEKTRSDVADALKRMDDKIALIEQKIESTVDQLDYVAEKAATPTIAFRARLNQDLALSPGQTLVFPVALLNEGGGYNTSTGIFTTPVGGTYIFSVTLCPWFNGGLTFNVEVDGLNQNTVLLYGNNGHTCYTSDTNLVLSKHQRVWVQALYMHNSGTHIDFTYEHRWNTFSGTLIHL